MKENNPVSIEQFLALITYLRDPKTGCPWDIKQNFDSMLPCLLEETYEVAEAIHNKDYESLKEELGDLLLQVVFLSQLATENNHFSFQDVLNAIHHKLITRHPHVFNGEQVKTSDEALKSWENSKAQEKSNLVHHSILDDLPFALPALTRANKLQKRCAKVGFDWSQIEEVIKKVEEELEEVKFELRKTEKESDLLQEELGDLLFSIVNLCRHCQFDAETLLRNGNLKFENRFRKIERLLKLKGKKISDCSIDELNIYWEQVKNIE